MVALPILRLLTSGLVVLLVPDVILVREHLPRVQYDIVASLCNTRGHSMPP